MPVAGTGGGGGNGDARYESHVVGDPALKQRVEQRGAGLVSVGPCACAESERSVSESVAPIRRRGSHGTGTMHFVMAALPADLVEVHASRLDAEHPGDHRAENRGDDQTVEQRARCR